MPPRPDQRPGVGTSLGDHEKRTRALERRHPRRFPFLLFDEEVLGGSGPLSIGAVFPSGMHYLELVWMLMFQSGGAEGILYLNLNDTFAVPDNDYFWNLDIATQRGPQGSTDATAESDSGGGVGYLPTEGNGFGRGRLIVPVDPVDAGQYTANGWTSHGSYSYNNGGQDTDSWTGGGYRQATDPQPIASLALTPVEVGASVAGTFGDVDGSVGRVIGYAF